MRTIEESIDYAERLIKGVRNQIDKQHEDIRKQEGMEECTMGTWLDAEILCNIIESEILPNLKEKKD